MEVNDRIYDFIISIFTTIKNIGAAMFILGLFLKILTIL